jgi:hypothetical protein
MKAYVKEITNILCITKNPITHKVWNTSATKVTLTNHISMDIVSRMLGHASINMTRKNARILDSTIGNEMKALSDKFGLN